MDQMWEGARKCGGDMVAESTWSQSDVCKGWQYATALCIQLASLKKKYEDDVIKFLRDTAT